MKIIIVGRSATGKTYLARLLQRRSLKLSKSYTTRECRSKEDKNNYHFITKEQANKIPNKNKLLFTKINNNEYFTLKEEIDKSDILILNPQGVEDIIDILKDENITIIYVTTNDTQKRKEMFVKRYENKEKGETAYKQRLLEEDKPYREFEEKLNTYYDKYKNVTSIVLYENKYDKNDIKQMANVIKQRYNAVKKLTEIIKLCITKNIMKNKNNKIILKNGKQTYETSPETYAEKLLNQIKEEQIENNELFKLLCLWLNI